MCGRVFFVCFVHKATISNHLIQKQNVPVSNNLGNTNKNKNLGWLRYSEIANYIRSYQGRALQNQQPEQVDINGEDVPSLFLTPTVALEDSSIVYPDFGQNKFQIKDYLINLITNTLQIFGLPHENSNTHISRFLRNSQDFHFMLINEDPIKFRLSLYILRDAVLEWLVSEPYANIMTWEDLARKFARNSSNL